MGKPEVRRILCPVDFSDTSRAALAWAVYLSRQLGAGLTLLHVFQAPSLALPDGVIVGGAELMTDVIRQVDEAMAGWRAEAEELGATELTTDTALGATHPEITRYAREHGFDLIVLGTHGRTGLTHVLLGSTAEKVVRHAHCAVLTVRPGAATP
jgi:universal stress protein A